MTIPLFQVSTFATDFRAGNQAGVVLLEADRDDAWYADVAAYLNLPATAFLRPTDGGFALRWFSPTRELPLCGHGTLAAAHVLYETGRATPDEVVTMTTAAGGLAVRREGPDCWIELAATALKEAPAPQQVLDALGVAACSWFGEGDDDLVVVLDSVEAVLAVAPDAALLRVLPQTRTVVTAAGGDGVDFTSRVFPPSVGVDEDQVTGTAHAALGPYWSDRLGRTRLTARQASQRGGLLELDLARDGVVGIGGRTVTVTAGALLA
ncbi:PhzF family phenazine biosynthesis protein [Acidothermaceae bacterium B102]|nr:PhzF family phenazine biosynthesis protein [Acidothermaceae bacterium B102]